MLRITFISIIILVGAFYAVISPFYALCFYLWHAYFRPEEWIWWVDLTFLHMSLIIGTFLVFRTLVTVPNPKINARTMLIWLFLAQAVVGTITSEHPDASMLLLQDFSKVMLISYLIVVLVTDRLKFRTVLIVMALSLGLECAKQGWADLILTGGAKNDNKIGFLGDNNGVALGTMMLVPILGALAQTTLKPWRRRAYWFIAVGVFFRGFTTYSRGGFLAASVLGLLTFARAEKKARALVGVLLVAGLVWAVMPQEFWNRIQTITASDENRDESAAGRLHFWMVGVKMAQAKPLTGVGLESFAYSYEKYDPNSIYGDFRQTHSTWFGVLAELGLPGFILFLANLAFAFNSCRRVVKEARLHPERRELAIYANALITSLIVFSVAGTFLSSQYSEMYWHFIALSTALSLVAAQEATATVKAPVAAAVPVPRYAAAR